MNEKDKKKACVILLNEMKADLKLIQVGKTMILYKGQQNLELELKRNLAIERLIKKVQALYKGNFFIYFCVFIFLFFYLFFIYFS